MKKIISILFIIGLIFIVLNIKFIYTYIDINFLNKNYFNRTTNKNNYVLNINQNFVSNTTKKIIENRQDLLNLVYTSLNYHWNEFSFYCSDEYPECFKELNNLAKENGEISLVNDLVHPYNKYNEMQIDKNNLGRITISYKYVYSNEMQNYINQQIKKIINDNNLISDTLSIENKIKIAHDALINYSNYSTDNKEDKTAYGFFKNHKGNCRGYTEAMSILLYELNIKTVPISNGHHVWNLILLDNNWYHTDVTWDDPTSTDGKDYLIYDFFMIDSDRLEVIDKDNVHIYDKDFYNKSNFLNIS